jgi:hypothetical protein
LLDTWKINIMPFGPTFGDEIIAAGLGGLPLGWNADGVLTGRDLLTPDQNTTLDGVIAAHDPTKPARRLVAKSLVISRLTDAQLDLAINAMTNRQKERWRAPDHPEVYSDDAETVAMIKAIGADPVAVLAPPPDAP